MQANQFLGDVMLGQDRAGLLNLAARNWLIKDARLKKMASVAGVPEKLQSDSAVAFMLYSTVIAAHNSKMPIPKTWAEFWDVRRFPGARKNTMNRAERTSRDRVVGRWRKARPSISARPAAGISQT